ncbi:hypothetical protein SAMN05444159_0351 [Bradyrhizobium lablabi]|uniref:Dolichyl-phosphate-mannose-protein mannosyltransferase n=1 Tax=Bradyrhizobium lablabi TaxID=722472 RepID=A0A1M6IGN1_9BRAD|nr:hypothetical protein [Bradyrhizobium lablabi]SHJ33592.1 hypothetical protein SAMN05444159_0351 [Bradyrhizobium lablabi]
MNQISNPALTTAPKNDATRDAFDRLTFLGWRWGLAAIVGGLAVSFFLFGYALIYWRNADMDFMVIYNALALNDGKPQLFFDHTAYLTILALKAWFQLLHGLGLLDAYSLSAMPPASNPAAFDAAMSSAVRAGRVLAFLIATGCVLIFAALARLMLRDWRVALIATLAFAFSGGVAVHSRILRSELVAACPVIFALMLLIVAGRRATPTRPLALAAAAALCVLGLENKVQAILLIGALPLMVLPFGSGNSAGVAFWRQSRLRWLLTGIAALAAIAAAGAAWPLIATGLDRALLDAGQFHPLLLGRFGIYQVALATLIGGCMTAYAMIWRVSAAETLASMSAVIAGAAIALLVLDLDYNTSNVIAVINPLEKMLTFADTTTTDAANGSNLLSIFLLLFDGVGSVLARYTFVLHSSPRPTVFLTWLIVPGIILAWRRGERLVAIQALVLLLGAIGIDSLGVRRGLKSEYFIFTDPLIILSGAILLDCLSDLRFHKWAYPIAAVLFGLHIAVGQAEPIKYAFMRRGPESACAWQGYYMPLMPLPWCPARP